MKTKKPFNYDQKEIAKNVDYRSNINALSLGYWLFFIQRWHNNSPTPINCRGPFYYQGNSGKMK
ncbi:hypothetical protein [Arenibacter troitsensis]